MNLNFILFVIIPFALMAVISLGMPFYKLKIMKMAGQKLLPLASKSSKLSFIASGLAIVLMFLSLKINFGRLNFVIPYCAVLGLFIAVRESTFIPVNGVYEKLLIVGSDILFYDDIMGFPLEELAAEERAHYPDYILLVVTKKRGKRQLTFSNSNEVAEVLTVLKKKCHFE